MRIIGGKFKGKRILQPIDKNTRPLRDLVKESIFNLIEHSKKISLKLDKLYILDLFSGTGSFGLECISRGAKEIVFIENYSNAIKILTKNIISLNLKENCKIFQEDCFLFFNSKNHQLKKFDIIFLDPPFKEYKISLLIKKIKENKILKQNGIIIIHRHKKDQLDISDDLNILEVRNYGLSKVIFGN